MASLRNILLALSSLSSLAYAAPVKENSLEDRNLAGFLCALENPIISALGAKASASTFCSSYLSIQTQTFTATVTATTSTTATTTLSTGTQVITAPTSTSTVISSVTTTSVVLTTSDDTIAEATGGPAKRGAVNVPPALLKLAATALSSACSCLSIPAPSITNTLSLTSTVSLTSTASTYAGTITTTPVDYTTTTATDTATSTSTILKSYVLSSIVAIIDQNSYQPFCSSILTYTTPITTDYQTTTATTAITASSTTTVTSYSTVTTTSTIQGPVAKRQNEDQSTGTDPIPTTWTTAPDARATPVDLLGTYPADYVSSACSMAVSSPALSTISSTITLTSTQTSVQVATVTTQATSTATATCRQYPVTNGGFETGTLRGWTVYNPINGAGGSWSVVSSTDPNSGGTYAAQITMLNPDTTKYGGFVGYLSQVLSTCVGSTYTVSFDYDCTTVNAGLQIYAYAGSGNSGQFSCPSGGSWHTKTFTFTATSATTTFYLWPVQNGVGQGVIVFDNVVATMN